MIRRMTVSAALVTSLLGFPIAANAGTDQAEPTVISEQVDQRGARYTERSDGTWRLELPTSSRGAAPWPDSCYGHFSKLPVVNHWLEWGADQTCENPARYPHWFRLVLQSTCDGAACVKFKTEGQIYSPGRENYWRTTRATSAEECINSNRRKYRMKHYAVIKGVEYGPFFSSEMTRACSV